MFSRVEACKDDAEFRARLKDYLATLGSYNQRSFNRRYGELGVFLQNNVGYFNQFVAEFYAGSPGGSAEWVRQFVPQQITRLTNPLLVVEQAILFIAGLYDNQDIESYVVGTIQQSDRSYGAYMVSASMDGLSSSSLSDLLFNDLIAYIDESYPVHTVKQKAVVAQKAEPVPSSTAEHSALLVSPQHFNLAAMNIDDKRIFVIGEFTTYFFETFIPFLKQTVEHPTLRRFGFQIVTAKQYNTERIDRRIWQDIATCGIVVAYLDAVEVAGKLRTNFNVSYELGIAHTLGKEVVLIASNQSFSSHKDLPFDIGTRNTILVDPNKLRAEQSELLAFLVEAHEASPKWPTPK